MPVSFSAENSAGRSACPAQSIASGRSARAKASQSATRSAGSARVNAPALSGTGPASATVTSGRDWRNRAQSEASARPAPSVCAQASTSGPSGRAAGGTPGAAAAVPRAEAR